MTSALTREDLRNDIAEALGEEPSNIADDDNLVDLGLDSIRILMLSTRWRDAGFDIGFLDLADEPTIEAWSKLAGAGAQP